MDQWKGSTVFSFSESIIMVSSFCAWNWLQSNASFVSDAAAWRSLPNSLVPWFRRFFFPVPVLLLKNRREILPSRNSQTYKSNPLTNRTRDSLAVPKLFSFFLSSLLLFLLLYFIIFRTFLHFTPETWDKGSK